jgi:hypothetical protein
MYGKGWKQLLVVHSIQYCARRLWVWSAMPNYMKIPHLVNSHWIMWHVYDPSSGWILNSIIPVVEVFAFGSSVHNLHCMK